MSTTSYFVKSAEIRADGVLRIRTAGADDEIGLWDGYHEVAPNDPDYRFWLWLQRRLKRRWFGPAGISEVAETQNLLASAEYQDAAARVDVWRALLARAVAQGSLASFVDLLRASGAP